MGNEQPKKQQTRQLTQFQIDVACLKVKGYVELNRDRRTNQALLKEKNLNELLRSPSRVKVEEYQKFQSLVQDVRFIETCNIVIRYCDIVKDQSIRICKSLGDPSKITDMMPYIESILFAADNLNLQQVLEFKDLMVFYFGPGLYDTNKLLCVDPDLKKLYKNPLPDAYEVNEFVIKFAEKYGFSEEQINAAGHQFSSKFLQPATGGILVDQPGYNNQFVPGGFVNQPQNGFGAPQGGFGNDPFGGFGNQPNTGFGQPGYTPPPQGFGNPQNGGFGNQPNGTFGNSQPQGFGNTQPQGGFGNTQPQGGFGNSQPQGGFGNTQPQGGFGNSQPQGGFGNPQPNQQTGGFGQPPIQPSPYSQQPLNQGNPYSGISSGPQIMASQKMKSGPNQSTNLQNPLQPIQPQNQQNVPNNNNQTPNDLDDLEARLARLNQGL